MIVRVPGADSEETGWVLDHGAAGVLVPRVQGIREAARAAAATRYAGARGLDPGSRASALRARRRLRATARTRSAW